MMLSAPDICCQSLLHNASGQAQVRAWTNSDAITHADRDAYGQRQCAYLRRLKLGICQHTTPPQAQGELCGTTHWPLARLLIDGGLALLSILNASNIWWSTQSNEGREGGQRSCVVTPSHRSIIVLYLDCRNTFGLTNRC